MLLPLCDPIAAVTHPDPYPFYAALREAAPVHWLEHRRLWAVASASAVNAVLHEKAARVRPVTEPVPRFLLGSRAGEVFRALARMNDGPAHAGQRERVMQGLRKLTPEVVAAAADRALTHVTNAWRERPDGAPLDALITRMPVLSMAAALGVSSDRWDLVLACIDDWVSGLSPLADEGRQRGAVEGMERLLATLGTDDIDDAAVQVALFMQPHEATAGLIGNGLLRLMKDAALRESSLSAGFSWHRFGAEVLRHDPPVQNTRRFMAADTTLEGACLREGDTVLLLLAAASRDPAVHEAPDEFRLDRPMPGGLALGAGSHTCPGGDAAVAIAAAVWRHVVGRTPLRPFEDLAHTVAWRPSVNARIPVFGPRA
ncbi:MAG: putative cytochrome [Rhizobacter sp.]|nr:putative cytochrome [Rhizobacter sp.]